MLDVGYTIVIISVTIIVKAINTKYLQEQDNIKGEVTDQTVWTVMNK